MKKRIDFLNDELTKNLFKNKKILLYFLNSVFIYSDKPQISEFTYEDREFDPKFYKGKKSFLDLYVKTTRDEGINLEIQKRKEKNFSKRTLRYLMRLADSLSSGEDDGKMQRSVSVNLVNFDLDEIILKDDFHYSSGVRSDKFPHELMLDVLEIHFINIKKWRKLNKNITDRIENMHPLSRWTAFFCNSLSKAERKALIRSDPMLQEAHEININYLSKRENRIAYIKAQKIAAHEKAVIEQAVDETVDDIVRNMKRENFDIAMIKKITGLSEEAINACQIKK